ncbi:MAG TPA: multicopper oxidase family protein [Candidatus Paceibacterota bacterium]|nr:multicopper oxidase family protein [Candidatus Paceibacterota bacterium]
MTKKYLYIAIIAVVVIAGIVLYQKSPLAVSAYVSTDVVGLSEVKAPETVELKNGDTYTLTASYVSKNINGMNYRMLAYNGSIPGPVIKVPQGARVTINFKNDTDMPTLLHSHGVRMDNQFDGSQTSQDPIPPGGSFAYTLKFPDAGMYWYHPHVREDLEQELGLYGNFLVVPTDGNYWDPVNQEVPLTLDDILIQNGKIDLSKQAADHTLMGRYGNVMLVNGQTDYSLSAKKGEIVRFYITNVANARPFNFAIESAKLKLVGSDGGAYEQDQWKDSVVIGPSERAIVEVLFDKSGTFAIENKTPDQTYTIGSVAVSNESASVSYAKEFSVLKTHTATVTSIDPLRSYFDKAPDKKIAISITMNGAPAQMQMSMGGGHMMPDGTMMGGSMMSTSPDGIEWNDTNMMSGGMSTTDNVKWTITDQDTGKVNSDIKWTFKKNQPVKIEIYNDPHSMHPMQHPIHFHGQQFLVLSVNGVKQTDLVWKDTVLVPSGQTVDILLYPTNPGTWMAHCHIAEHLEDGMMFTYTVE